MSRPEAFLGCFGVGAILGLIGPFNTNDVFGPVARLIYWIAVAGVSYAIGAPVSIVLYPRLPAPLPQWARLGIASCATGIGIFAAITVGNGAVFGIWPSRAEPPGTLALFIAISALVTFLLELLPSAIPTPQPPRLLQRLPIDKRGPLLALSVEGHYVRVRTTMGEEMVLMRLTDAMAQLRDSKGLPSTARIG